jgi:hypothetical protein
MGLAFDKWSGPLRLLEKATLFQIIATQHLMTPNQLANTVCHLACLLLLIICGIPSFFSAYAGKYSYQSLPPLPLKLLWPKQIRGIIKVGLVFAGFALVLIILCGWGENPDIITSKTLPAVLICLSLGIFFIADGLISGSLYVYFYFKYWRLSD